MTSLQTQPLPVSLAERYRVLLEIGRALTGTIQGEAELYTAIYRETAQIMEADGFYVSLYDPAIDLARVVFWADRGQGRFASIPYPGSESEVIRTGRGTLVNDGLEARARLVVGEGDAPSTRSAVSAPLRSRDRLLGVISAQSYNPDAYTRSDLELLQGIADVSAVAVQNVRHVQELDQRRREAERMEQISQILASSLDSEQVLNRVVEGALDLLRGDGAMVWLLEEDVVRVGAARGGSAPHVGTETSADHELVRRLRNDPSPVVMERLQSSPLLPGDLQCPPPARSALLLPLSGAEGVTGALVVTTPREGPFPEEEIHLLQRLAGHASVALENARLHSALETLSLTDPLTGLPNRRQLEIHLEREFAAAQRGRPLSIVLFDVDHFKEYNDTRGHVAGDQALRALARILDDETRAMNLVARYGGDEFLAVLSDTGSVGAEQHAGRVHARIAADPDLRAEGLTLSSGTATFTDEMGRVEDLIREADQDMYRSKAQTRNAS